MAIQNVCHSTMKKGAGQQNSGCLSNNDCGSKSCFRDWIWSPSDNDDGSKGGGSQGVNYRFLSQLFQNIYYPPFFAIDFGFWYGPNLFYINVVVFMWSTKMSTSNEIC